VVAENVGGTWLDGATGPQPARSSAGRTGAASARGSRWRRSSTRSRVRRFSFRVAARGFKVAEWGYSFEPTATGCRVTETWRDQRSRFFKPISGMATGVSDRATYNRAGMEQTLERLAAVARPTRQST
jgi:hypothetical protein